MRLSKRIAWVVSLGVLFLVVQYSTSTARPAVYKMSCRQAIELVSKAGAIVLSTGDTTFDRFVRDQGFCDRGKGTTPAWAAAADNPTCAIGYTCEETIGGIP